MKYGLTETTVENICAVFARFPEIEKAILYGSRAKGNFKTGSDIDLTLFGEALTSDLRSTIASALDDLLLPYTIDLSVFNELNHAKLREHIERVGVLFYERANHGIAMKKGWKTKTLGEICEIERGGSPRPIDSFLTDAPDGINWIKIGDTKNVTKYITRTAAKIRHEGAKRSRMVYEGDFILSNSMSFGRPYIMKTTGCIHDGWLALRQPTVDQDYLYHVLSSDLVFNQFDRLAAGSTVRNLNIGLVKGVQIPVPPLPEQQRIVGILNETFDGIANAKANAEKNLQNARALFASHRQSVFTQRGEGWVEKTVDHISTNLDSKRIPITKSDRTRGEFPYYGASGIVDYVADYIFEGDTLLVSEDGANLLARSTPIAFSVSGKYWVNNHAHILKFESMATQRFVEFYLESIKLDEYITGAAQPKLNQKALNSIPIPIPKSTDAQAQIVKSIELLSTETQRLESIYQQKLDALEALKKSLLHQAFSGQL